MFERYGALFALRDRAAEAHAAGSACSDRATEAQGSTGRDTRECDSEGRRMGVSEGGAARGAAVEAIVAALFGCSSALLRHEVRPTALWS